MRISGNDVGPPMAEEKKKRGGEDEERPLLGIGRDGKATTATTYCHICTNSFLVVG